MTAGIIVYIKYIHKLHEIYLRYFHKLIVPQCQDSQINHIFDFRRNIFKIVIAENKNLSIVPIVFYHFCKILQRHMLPQYSYKTYLRYNARSVCRTQKFPGILSSLRLLYERSRTSRTGKDPNPLGKLSNRFIARFKIL